MIGRLALLGRLTLARLAWVAWPPYLRLLLCCSTLPIAPANPEVAHPPPQDIEGYEFHVCGLKRLFLAPLTSFPSSPPITPPPSHRPYSPFSHTTPSPASLPSPHPTFPPRQVIRKLHALGLLHLVDVLNIECHPPVHPRPDRDCAQLLRLAEQAGTHVV